MDREESSVLEDPGNPLHCVPPSHTGQSCLRFTPSDLARPLKLTALLVPPFLEVTDDPYLALGRRAYAAVCPGSRVSAARAMQFAPLSATLAWLSGPANCPSSRWEFHFLISRHK